MITIYIIKCEFIHNWLYLIFQENLSLKITKVLYDQINNELFYENIYVSSEIIDSVWRSLILSTKIYNEFWLELWGGFIDRVEPRFSNERVLKQNQLEDFLDRNQTTFQPYYVLWNKSLTSNNENNHTKYNILLKKSELCDVIRKVGAYIFKLSNFIENDEIIQCSEEIYDFIMNMHNDLLADHNEIGNKQPYIISIL